MWILDFAKWLMVVPATTVWVDLRLSQPIWDTIWKVVWMTDFILDWITGLLPQEIAELTSSALIPWASAALLSNEILKDVGLVWEKTFSTKNLLRYTANWAAMLWAYSMRTAATPYLVAWAWAYFIGKYGWRFGKELVKRWVWTAWWLTWWVIKRAVVWGYKSAKAWTKWEQRWNPVIN